VTIAAAVEMSRSGTLIPMSIAVRHLTPPELDGFYQCMANAFGGRHDPALLEADPPILDYVRQFCVTRF